MNIHRAYFGAFSGLHPLQYTQHIRNVQVSICTQLALMRQRGTMADGDVVTAAHLRQLKNRELWRRK